MSVKLHHSRTLVHADVSVTDQPPHVFGQVLVVWVLHNAGVVLVGQPPGEVGALANLRDVVTTLLTYIRKQI